MTETTQGVLAVLLLLLLLALIVVAVVENRRLKREGRRQAEALAGCQARLVSHARSRPGFELGNHIYLGVGSILVAVNQRADSLLVACDSEQGVQSRLWACGEVVSVELVTDIQSDSLFLGGITALGDHPLLGIGGWSWSELKGVWLKVLVRDVQHPWLVFAMPSLLEAEKWRGLITLMTQKAA